MDVHRSRFVPYPASGINAVSFSRSNDKGLSEPKPALKLAIGRANGNIEIWSPAKGDWVQEVVFPGGQHKSIDALAWIQEPDDVDYEGKPILGQLRLFSIGSTEAVTEWNLVTGRPLRSSTGNFSEVWCLAAQPRWKASKDGAVEGEYRGQNLVAGCGDGTLAILSTADDDLVFKRFLARSGSRKTRCMSVTWQNRDIVVAGFTDSNIRIYDTRSGALLRNMSLGAGIPGAPKDTLVWRLKCLPNGDIVSADSNGEVRFWDGRTYSLTQRVSGHDSDCLDIVTSSDGQTVFSGGMDGRIAIYKLGGREGERQRWAKSSHRRLHAGDIKSMAVYDSKAMSVVVSGGVDASLAVTPLRTFNKELFRRLPALPQQVPCTSAPSQRLLVSWWDRNVCIWRVNKPAAETFAPDTRSRKLVSRIAIKGKDNIVSTAISQDGNLLAVSTAVDTKVFQLRPSKDGSEDRLRVRTLELPKAIASVGARFLAISPDGHWISIVSLENEVIVGRIAASTSETKKLEIFSKTVELERQSRKSNQQTGLKLYERNTSQLAFSPDSSVLVTADLSGYIDSWVLEGHFDPTAPAIDTAAHDSASGSSDSSSSSDSDSDSDEEENTIFYGQHWTDNRAASSLPKLSSAPLVLSFRPSTPTTAVLGNPGVHPTRANPHAHSHALPTTQSRLLIITAQHQIHEFDMLTGKLTDWSRRNPTSVLPAEFQTIKDRTMGVVWDSRGDQNERIWMYGSTWVGMLDVSQDYQHRVSETDGEDVEGDGDEAVAGEGEGKKRKRLENEKWNKLQDKRRKVKGFGGAGDKIKDEERGGAPASMRRIDDGESMDIDLDVDVRPEHNDDEDDQEGDEAMLGPLRRIEDADDEDVEGGVRRRWWCTYKYRPILGMVPIGTRSEIKSGDDQEDEDASPLEVVLVERPPWQMQDNGK